MKSNWFRNIVGGISLTSAMFIFQACYGTPQDFTEDLLVEGVVVSDSTGVPIEGIRISVANTSQYFLSEKDGSFNFYTRLTDTLTLKFEDIDQNLNGQYVDKDTLITTNENFVFVQCKMEAL